MTQCMNAKELHMDDTISHVDGLDLIQGLSSKEVHERALAARKIYGKAQKALTHWIMEMDERKLYRDFGCSNVFQYATRFHSLGEHTIAEMLRTGKALAKLPVLSDAYDKGQISSTHIREISRVAVPETEQFWCEAAKKSTTHQIEKMVAITPRGELPATNSAILQPAHSTKDLAISPALQSDDRLKCTSTGEEQQKKYESASEITSNNDKEMNHQSGISRENTVVGALQNQQVPIKYNDKLTVELSNIQMVVLKDAFEKARKESGLKDRASLLEYIAKAFLQSGMPAPKKRNKPSYQIVIHRHLPSGLTWCNTPNGERPVPPEVLEKAISDAEIVELDVPESPPRDQNDEKETNSGVMTENTDRQKADVQKEANEYINEQYMKVKVAEKEKHTYHKGSCKSSCKKGRSIPAALRKKVLLRDGCTCQAPGCGRQIFLTIHHLIAFAICGIHSISGLITLCSKCHALVHEGKLSVEGEAPHGLIWRDEKGRVDLHVRREHYS